MLLVAAGVLGLGFGPAGSARSVRKRVLGAAISVGLILVIFPRRHSAVR